MTDILHAIPTAGDLFKCGDCGTDLPPDLIALGDDIIDLNGAGVHWVPAFAYEGTARKCSDKKAKHGTGLVVCISCNGKGCGECNENGIVCSDGSTLEVEVAEPRGGETLEVAPPRTEFEKQATRMGIQNFVNMREMSKPE